VCELRTDSSSNSNVTLIPTDCSQWYFAKVWFHCKIFILHRPEVSRATRTRLRLLISELRKETLRCVRKLPCQNWTDCLRQVNYNPIELFVTTPTGILLQPPTYNSHKSMDRFYIYFMKKEANNKIRPFINILLTKSSNRSASEITIKHTAPDITVRKLNVWNIFILYPITVFVTRYLLLFALYKIFLSNRSGFLSWILT